IVVIIACVIVGAYLWGADQILSHSSATCSSDSRERQSSDVPLVRDQHLLRPREQGEGQSRAPDRLDEPAAALPARRRADRAGDREQGWPEGPDREARAPRVR